VSRKILFFISSFQAGGAERVASILLERWREEGWDIVAAQWSSKEPYYAIAHEITLLRLGLNNSPESIWAKLISPLRRFFAVRSTMKREKPDIVVSFMTKQNLYSIAAARSLGIPVIVSEHNHRGASMVTRRMDRARVFLYPKADRVTVLTERDLEAYPFLENALVMPNPLAVSPGKSPAARFKDILAVGRLDPQKGFDILIEAFSMIADKNGTRLLIAGEGAERKALEGLIRSRGLEDVVLLLGRRDDIYELYQKSMFLVLSSRFEGFGMVLIEAMAFGCPVVAFDCPCGPGEIIHDGIDGLLVPHCDVDALAAAMERMLRDDVLRDRLGQAGPTVRERFGIDKIAMQWKRLFEEVLAARCKGPSV